MSSVIYSNRRDFFTNHRNKLDSLGIFFFLGFFGLFVCLFYILMPNSRQTMVFYLKKYLFSVDKHSVWGRIWHTK